MSTCWSRRRFATVCGLSLAVPPLVTHAQAAARPGADHPLASFDREMEAHMQARQIPGGALAVARNGLLLYQRGYGWADRDHQLPVTPASLFRIASVSKPITATGILRLVEAGKLSLSDPVVSRLKPERKPTDPRWEKITIRHLLHHTAGWDREASGDPMFQADRIAKTLGVPCPPGPKNIVHYMLSRPLDFDPGSRHVYSNFGYCVLGRVMESITGQNYETWTRQTLLEPAGVTEMRVGHSLKKGAAPSEVSYYTSRNRKVASIFPQEGEVPPPYGSFCLEAMDAHGGWIATAGSLVKFALALQAGGVRPPLLKPETARLLTDPPAPPVARRPDGSLADSYYGLGWMIRPVGHNQFNLWHNGSLPGTSTLLVSLGNGLTWAALFNQRSEETRLPDGAIDAALHRAARAVTHWPEKPLTL